ncbi:Biopolymer transport protein ExbD/TolR [compost metagenome]
MSELEQQLRNALANDAELPVILRGDRAVQYDKVMAVLDLCSKLGISSIGLASQRQAAG